MRLGTFFTIAVMGVALLAGLEKLSLWWVLIPAFFAGSLGLSNGPHYAAVVEANQQGNLWLFPLQLTIYCAGQLILAGAVYWITRILA